MVPAWQSPEFWIAFAAIVVTAVSTGWMAILGHRWSIKAADLEDARQETARKRALKAQRLEEIAQYISDQEATIAQLARWRARNLREGEREELSRMLDAQELAELKASGAAKDLGVFEMFSPLMISVGKAIEDLLDAMIKSNDAPTENPDDIPPWINNESQISLDAVNEIASLRKVLFELQTK